MSPRRGARTKIHFWSGRVRKFYHPDYVDRWAREVMAYRMLEDFSPRLLAVGDRYLDVERHPPIIEVELDYRHADALWDLLERLHASGWWHGDIALRNVVLHPQRGPLLIDLETTMPAVSDASYDLYGARAAGTATRHEAAGPDGVWWGGPWKDCPGVWWK